jgi:hypothetical protein
MAVQDGFPSTNGGRDQCPTCDGEQAPSKIRRCSETTMPAADASSQDEDQNAEGCTRSCWKQKLAPPMKGTR